MAENSELVALTPLDHAIAKFYLPYILHFNTPDTKIALHTIEHGIKKLACHLPWLAGDVIFRDEPCDPQNKGYIVSPHSLPEALPMLRVKHFYSDEEFDAHPVQAYLPLPCLIPVSQQRPVLRFQANVFPSKIIFVMSFMHAAMDGTGAGIVLQALAECCKATDGNPGTVTASIAKNEVKIRQEVSSWPLKYKTRLDHSLELGPPVFDSSITSEQWAAMEAAMSSVVKMKKFTFSPQKISQVKEACNKFLPEFQLSSFVSSNDIITAILGICIDRAQHPMGASQNENATVTMTVDLRNRVNPPLSSTSVGNMSFPIRNNIHFPRHKQASVRDGIEADFLHLTQLALQLRSKLGSMNESFAYSVSAAVAARGDWCSVEAKPGDVIVTSWRHLKVFSVDFGEGLGKIYDFDAGLSLVPGACILMPLKAQENAFEGQSAVPWEASITMKAGDFDILVNDPLFSRVLA